MNMLWWLIVGAIAGWLTGEFTKGSGYGLIGNIIVGILGGVIGGWLLGALGIDAGGIVGSIVVAFIGGGVLVAVLKAIRRT